jgi:glutaminase
MEIPLPHYLSATLDRVREDTSGAVADYIPELAAADPDPLAVALCTATGHVYSAGDDGVEFSIQSIANA